MKTYGRKRSLKRCSPIDLDFGELCRLCLCTSSERQNIFDSKGDVPLPIKIQTCVSLEVYQGDGLPSEVCYKCIKLLETFYRFYKRCGEVNSKLHDISTKVKEVQLQAKVLKQKQEVNGKLSIVDLLCAEKEVESQEITNNAVCIMDSLFVDSESINGNKGESLDCRIKDICNNSSITESEAQNNSVPVTRSDAVNKWQSGITSTEVEHFQNSENISSSKFSLNNLRNVSTDDCISNDTIENSKSQSSCIYGNLEPLSETISELIFMCDKCPKGFAKWIDLKRHSSVHDQQRGFVCGECEKWFPNKGSYKRHERIHTGERPFCCSYCQKCFSQETILSRHVLIHTGEKPYKCETCSKGFTQREGLRVHMRCHDHGDEKVQQRLYYCPLCKKGFCHQSGLSRHLITHTGKTFDCQVCSKSFSDKSSLKRHTRKHSSIKNEVGS